MLLVEGYNLFAGLRVRQRVDSLKLVPELVLHLFVEARTTRVIDET
jgi:hypothetical protein